MPRLDHPRPRPSRAALLLAIAVAATLLASPTTARADDLDAIEARIEEKQAVLTKMQDEVVWLEQQIADSPRAAAQNFDRRRRIRELEGYQATVQSELAELSRRASKAKQEEVRRAREEARLRAEARRAAANAAAESPDAPAEGGAEEPTARSTAPPDENLDGEEIRGLIDRWAAGESGVPGQVEVKQQARDLMALRIATGEVLRDEASRPALFASSAFGAVFAMSLSLLFPMLLLRSRQRRDEGEHDPQLAALGLGACVLFVLVLGGSAVYLRGAFGDRAAAGLLLLGAALLVAAAFGDRRTDFLPLVGTTTVSVIAFGILTAIAVSPYGPTGVALLAPTCAALAAAQAVGVLAYWRLGGRRLSWATAGIVAAAVGVAGGAAGLGFAAIRLVSA